MHRIGHIESFKTPHKCRLFEYEKTVAIYTNNTLGVEKGCYIDTDPKVVGNHADQIDTRDNDSPCVCTSVYIYICVCVCVCVYLCVGHPLSTRSISSSVTVYLSLSFCLLFFIDSFFITPYFSSWKGQHSLVYSPPLLFLVFLFVPFIKHNNTG